MISERANNDDNASHLAVIGSEVPQPDGLVQGAGEESVVRGVHGEGDHPLVVTTEVSDVLVLFE